MKPTAQHSDLDIQAAFSCANTLDGLGDKFINTFHATERDFLRLGSQLENLNAKAMALSEDAKELAALTSGEALLQSSTNLGAVLGSIGGVCEMGADAADFGELGAIAKTGVGLTGLMRDFSRLVKHLSMLGMATRIESARLGGSGLGFSTLANDVETLASKIVISSGKILERCKVLTDQTLLAEESVKAIQQVREGCSTNIVGLLKKDLDALDTLNRNSRSSAQGVSLQAKSLCDSVSNAVLSLQFHDIIRQQLEHVAEHSEEVRQEVLLVLKHDSQPSDENPEALAPWLHGALLLQRSQLGNARVRFAEAMQSLEDSLREIGSQID